MARLIVVLRLRYIVRLFRRNRVLSKFPIIFHHLGQSFLQVLDCGALRNFLCLFPRSVPRSVSCHASEMYEAKDACDAKIMARQDR